MRGSIYTFMGSIVMLMIGVGIIWWFRSVAPSEAFIVSERHRESFSALNYLELARKSVEEAVVIYAQTGATKAGYAGGLDNKVPQKDKIAIWKTAPDEDTIKDTLQKYVVDEIAALQQHIVVGKFLTADYGSSNIEIIPDDTDFSKSEKFFVKGDKDVKVSKSLKTQAITISSGLKSHTDQEIKLKYFALYDAAKKFLESGEPKKRINIIFNGVKTDGTATNNAPKCETPAAACDPADAFSNVCPTSEASEPTAQEVLATTSYPTLKDTAISITLPGEPFENFKAAFDKYELLPSAGYDSADVATDNTGTCSFSCNYQKPCGAPIITSPACGNGCSYDSGSNSCEPPVCGVAPACEPCSYDDIDDFCIVPECGAPVITAPTCDNGCAYEKASNSCKSPSFSQSCSAGTKKKTMAFTFLVDAYEKYSSEDPTGIVPSTSIHNMPVVAKTLPYDTLKFNFMTHSCTTIKSGAADTELKDDAIACSMPADATNPV